MTDQEHVSKLLSWLPTVDGEQITIKVEDGNVIYSNGNDSCGIPMPDGKEEIIYQ